jgi:hypothetical protein
MMRRLEASLRHLVSRMEAQSTIARSFLSTEAAYLAEVANERIAHATFMVGVGPHAEDHWSKK